MNVLLNFGIRTFVEAVNNNKTARGRFLEQACLYQRLKGCYDQEFELDRERFGEDKWVACDRLQNDITNVGKVKNDLVGDGGDKWLESVARWIIPGEKETCEQHRLLAHLGDSLSDRGFPSSSGTINPHNKCLKIPFPLNPLHDLGENSQACVRVTFRGIETFI